MSLQLEEKVVCESVRSIPAVKNCSFLVFSIGQFFSEETIVFYIVDGFKIKNGDDGYQAVNDHRLEPIDKVY